MGRLCQELLLHSNCTTTTYLNQMSAWFDRDGRELIGMKTFALLMRSVEVFGVIGIDLLISFMIARDLVQLLNKIRAFVSQILYLIFAALLTRVTDETRQCSTSPSAECATIEAHDSSARGGRQDLHAGTQDHCQVVEFCS